MRNENATVILSRYGESCLAPCSHVFVSPVKHCDNLVWGREQGRGLQSNFIVKYFLKIRKEISAYENGHPKIYEIKTI